MIIDMSIRYSLAVFMPRPIDYLQNIVNIGIGSNEWWSESDDIVVGGFGYESIFEHFEGELPGILLFSCKLNTDKKTFASHFLHSRTLEY